MKINIIVASLLFLLPSLSFTRVKITYGFSTYQNQRQYQEDRFVHKNIQNGEFFGIYDGHVGDKTSSFLKDNLHTYFAQAEGSISERFVKAFERADYECQNSKALPLRAPPIGRCGLDVHRGACGARQ